MGYIWDVEDDGEVEGECPTRVGKVGGATSG